MAYYVKPPYAAQIELQGTDARLNLSLHQAFTDSFRKAVNEGTDTGFIKAVADNAVHDWKPTVPTQLYHGTADDLVFFFNSQHAYDAMQQQGANQVKLIPIRNGNHSTSIAQYALGRSRVRGSEHKFIPESGLGGKVKNLYWVDRI